MQYVKVNGAKSNKLVVRCSMLKSSILGPLLFIIYINDLVDYMNDGRVSLYADDTAL